MADLKLERRTQEDRTQVIGLVAFAPYSGEDYWTYRVQLTGRQAVLGFPKFDTIGIGFAVEEDWNTNLPYRLPTQEIADHIMHNKGNDSIPDDAVVRAVEIIRQACIEDQQPSPQGPVLDSPDDGDGRD